MRMRLSLDVRFIPRISLLFTDVSPSDEVGKARTVNRRSILTNGLIAAAWAAIPEFASPVPGPNPLTPSGPLKVAGAKCGIKVGVQAGKATLQFPDFVQVIKDVYKRQAPQRERKKADRPTSTGASGSTRHSRFFRNVFLSTCGSDADSCCEKGI